MKTLEKLKKKKKRKETNQSKKRKYTLVQRKEGRLERVKNSTAIIYFTLMITIGIIILLKYLTII